MITYNPKDWFTFIFRIHKADTVRKLFPLILTIAVYTAIITFFEKDLGKDSGLLNLSLMHSLLGFVISLLLVFRTNTAYDRWWEGRKQWVSLVNCSRNFAIKLNTILPIGDKENRKFFADMIPLYADVLCRHLSEESTRLALNEEYSVKIDHDKHRPNQVASMIFQQINILFERGNIRGEHLIILNNEMQSFTDICGACERIKNTPIPFSYSVFLKKFVFFYVMTLPFTFAISLGYWSIPVVAFIFYVLASLELVAEEIEDPFGKDANDLPTKKIAENIRKHVQEIL